MTCLTTNMLLMVLSDVQPSVSDKIKFPVCRRRALTPCGVHSFLRKVKWRDVRYSLPTGEKSRHIWRIRKYYKNQNSYQWITVLVECDFVIFQFWIHFFLLWFGKKLEFPDIFVLHYLKDKIQNFWKTNMLFIIQFQFNTLEFDFPRSFIYFRFWLKCF